ncbi:ArsR family transcriptional regulator [Rhodohalobacter sp. SW132]|uniref:winged helix-turn-helix domain-containing protein n=1 Tax=Rhodohalobacter sp. SW132 TaxID=2293433 RepID=UPI000E258577|nr:winged helix-turn-helix domain-containing protein [Rhodohalobacter sp. SW132]REL24511.1 ArsR family transcriptional regulator [Rhodohalobacter sp. SW132]
MRPVSSSDSALKTPLNEILGYPGNVRILRSMIERQNAMSYSELAERTDISLPGVHKVVNRLLKTGIIAYRGSGKRQLIAAREEHPLFEALSGLFHAEKERVESLHAAIKQEIGKLNPQPLSAWMYGKTAQGKDQYGDPLQIALFGKLISIDPVTDQFKERMAESGIESKYDITIQITGITQADLDENHITLHEGYEMLWGVDPIFFAEGRRGTTGLTTHAELDLQSLQAGKAWAKLIKIYPEIIRRTIRHLEKQVSETESGVKGELTEWKHLLESASLQRLAKFLESEDEKAVRLRQSTPFWQIITEDEREKLQSIIESLAS